MCTPNNMYKKKLEFIEKESETKHKNIKEMRSRLDERYAPINQV